MIKESLRIKNAGKPGIILMNGPSSAGKSSIAAELVPKLQAAGRTCAVISIDDFMKTEPDEPIWEDDVFEIVPDMCDAMRGALARGETVIVDHVITSERIFNAMNEAAEGFALTKVLVSCSVELLRKREAERGDRCIGMAEVSLQYLYPKEGYDICIDTGAVGPREAAELIAKAACLPPRAACGAEKH